MAHQQPQQCCGCEWVVLIISTRREAQGYCVRAQSGLARKPEEIQLEAGVSRILTFSCKPQSVSFVDASPVAVPATVGRAGRHQIPRRRLAGRDAVTEEDGSLKRRHLERPGRVPDPDARERSTRALLGYRLPFFLPCLFGPSRKTGTIWGQKVHSASR